MKINTLKNQLVLLIIISVVSLGITFLAVIQIGTQKSINKVSMQALDLKLNGDLNSLQAFLKNAYGSLWLLEDNLVDENDTPIKENNEIIDQISEELMVHSTIFSLQQNGFRREITSIRDESGNIASGTYLDNRNIEKAIGNNERFTGEVDILGAPFIAAYEPLFDNKEKLIGVSCIGIPMSAIEESVDKEIRNMFYLSLGNVLLIIILAIFVEGHILGRILTPVIKSIEVLKDISMGEGDLTQRLNIKGKSDIHQMGSYFNQTLEKIRQMVVAVKEESIKLNSIGVDLATNTTETASAVSQITRNIDNAKNKCDKQLLSVERTSEKMSRITEHIHSLSTSIEGQSSNIIQSSSAIEQMISNIRSVTGIIEKNTNNVNELRSLSIEGKKSLTKSSVVVEIISKESRGLLEISKIIENIAEQTNLLSMNAAIEAAHAGSSGKGFAVVAGEIRSLAESSGQQAKIISEILNKTKALIDSLRSSIEEVTGNFDKVVNSTESVQNHETSIKEAMDEQNQSSSEILKAISELNDITGIIREKSLSIRSNSNDVIDEVKSLEIDTKEIFENISEITSGAKEIDVAVNQVNAITEENRNSIEVLSGEIHKFKV